VKFVYLILSWIFGILFLLVGLLAFTTSIYAGLTFLVATALVFPPVRNLVFKKTNRRIPTKVRGISLVILVITGFALIGTSEANREQEENRRITENKAAEEEAIQVKNAEYFNDNRSEVVGVFTDSLASGNFHFVLREAKQYNLVEDKELKSLVTQATSMRAEKVRAERTLAIVTELKSVPETHYQTNLSLYTQLVDLNPNNSSYASKAEYYAQKAKDAEERRAELEAQMKKEAARVQQEQRAKAAREESIEAQFSAWNGAHRNLEKVIKSSMHNPDSFKHVETSYWDRGDHLVVRTTFRGTNGFGAVVTNSVKAKVSLGGQVLEILE